MGWDTGTLRVVCLVASAVSAGYLWRVALEGDSELGRLLDTSSPGLIAPAPTPSGPVWTAGGDPDRELGAERRSARSEPAAPVRKPAQEKRQAAKAPKARGERAQRPAARPEFASKPVARPRVPARPAPKPAPKPGGATARPKPKPPAPAPQPKPPTGGPGPTGGPPAPTPPAPEPVAPVPEPAPTPAPAPPGRPAPPTRPPDAQPLSAPQRPGWGHGDKNHEHTGPPKKQK